MNRFRRSQVGFFSFRDTEGIAGPIQRRPENKSGPIPLKTKLNAELFFLKTKSTEGPIHHVFDLRNTMPV
jgi:hypothetical protein